MFYSGGDGSSGEASCLSHTKDIRYLAVGSAWFVSAEELVGSDQGRFSEKWHKNTVNLQMNIFFTKFVKLWQIFIWIIISFTKCLKSSVLTSPSFSDSFRFADENFFTCNGHLMSCKHLSEKKTFTNVHIVTIFSLFSYAKVLIMQSIHQIRFQEFQIFKSS